MFISFLHPTCNTCHEKGLFSPLVSIFAVVEGIWMLIPAECTEPQCCIESLWPFQYSTFWRTHPFSNAPASPLTTSPAMGEARECPVKTERACENTLQEKENLLKKEYPIHSCDKDERRMENVIKLIHSLEKANKEEKVSCWIPLLVIPLDLAWVLQ